MDVYKYKVSLMHSMTMKTEEEKKSINQLKFAIYTQ